MQTTTDSLTGLPNRMALERELERLIASASDVAVALLDIDNFLGINTEHGHDTGDQVLQGLAGLLGEVPGGQAYRISGDELAVLLPGLSLEQAFLRMEAVRAQVHQAAERFALPRFREVTVTIGVAQYPRDAKDARSLLRAADAALESGKEAGRNQVSLPPNEEMVMKSCYYSATSIRRLKTLAERLRRKESQLLREALDDLLRKYDRP